MAGSARPESARNRGIHAPPPGRSGHDGEELEEEEEAEETFTPERTRSLKIQRFQRKLDRENAAIKVRNEERRIRRQENDGEVSENESEFDVDALYDNDEDDDGGRPARGASSGDIKNLAAIVKMLAPPTPASGSGTTASRKMITEDMEVDESRFLANDIVMPKALRLLVYDGIHVPLPLVITRNILKITMNPDEILTVAGLNEPGSKNKYIKTNMFGDEKDISMEDWYGAWVNLLHLLSICCERAIVGRFADFHDWMRGQTDLKEYFPSYLEFDTRARQEWALNRVRFPTDPDTLSVQFQKVHMKVLARQISESILTNSSGRFHPYAAPSASGSGSANHTSRPFRDGRPSDTSTEVCLVCARTGHRANACSFKVRASGRACFAEFRGNQLVAKATQRTICSWFNLRGQCSRPRSGTHGQHVCSYCGAADHHASSQSCL